MRKPDLPLPVAPSLPRRCVAGGMVAGALAPWWGAVGAASSAAPAPALGSGRPRCAVLYPDIGEPFRSVFLQMAQGIDQRSTQPSLRWALPANTPVSQVLRSVREQGVMEAIKLMYFGAAVELIRVAIEDGDHARGVQLIGQAQGLIDDVPSCSELMARLVADAEATRARLLAATGGVHHAA